MKNFLQNLPLLTKTTIESSDFPSFQTCYIYEMSGLTSIDFSGRTNTIYTNGFGISSCDSLTDIILPSSSTTNYHNVNGFTFENNPSLTGITNMEVTRYTNSEDTEKKK